MYKELKELEKRNMYLKGEAIEYNDLLKLKVGTLVVGSDSNNIYEVINGLRLYNRKREKKVSMIGMSACYFLGEDKLIKAEEW